MDLSVFLEQNDVPVLGFKLSTICQTTNLLTKCITYCDNFFREYIIYSRKNSQMLRYTTPITKMKKVAWISAGCMARSDNSVGDITVKTM